MNLRLFGKTGLAACVAAIVMGPPAIAHATDIRGAGSSFVYPVMLKWSAAYAADTGNRVNYQSIGSGGGITQIKAGTVDFGASDIPLDEAALKESGLGQFPDVIGGIVPVVNVQGVDAGDLVLDGTTLAAIFLGRITQWDDPAIAALNPDRALPSTKITVVHRSDGSGTTFNFTHYLSQISPDWKASIGESATVNWPAGIGGKGNEGVSAYVRQIPNAIGYVEYAYALQNQLAYTRMRNAAGKVVSPDAQSFQAAAATANWADVRHFDLLMTNAPGDGAWPITATSWVLMHTRPKNTARAKVALDFFAYAYADGKEAATALDYVPLPETLVNRIRAYWESEFAY